MSPEAYRHSEAALVKQLGLPAEKIRDVRAAELERGPDWATVHGAVFYSDAGLEHLAVALHVDASALVVASPTRTVEPVRSAMQTVVGNFRAAVEMVGALQKNSSEPRVTAEIAAAVKTTEPAPGEVRELEVVRVYSLNRHIVLARDGDQEVRVRVRDNTKLRVGMVMRCTHAERDLWDMAQRLPRHPGQW